MTWVKKKNLKQNEAQSAHAESTHRGVNHKVHKLHQRYTLFEIVPLVEYMYLVCQVRIVVVHVLRISSAN